MPLSQSPYFESASLRCPQLTLETTSLSTTAEPSAEPPTESHTDE
ncbi:hypothetical protein [Pyrobaculum ferrireducens]|nr:hypothetical protein [Pyrobaculum ferrireducens]